MNAKKIEEGKVYEVKVGKNTTTVQVAGIERRVNGQVVFDCLNVKTNKRMTVSDAKRFVKEVKPKNETAEAKPARVRQPRPDGTVSGIEAALIVLRESGEPMNIRQIMEAINERNLAKLPGKTPGATVSAAIQREISKKGENSRFYKAGKGLFAAK